MSEPQTKGTKQRMRRALSPDARENQMIALAMDLAEQQLRDGTASSQLITEFVKRGSSRYRLENEKIKEENKKTKAQTETLKSAKRVEELYADAIAAMKKYSGDDSDEEEDEEWDD